MTRKENPRITISGKVEGGIVNVGGEQNISGPVILNIQSRLENVSQGIGALDSADPVARENLQILVGQLQELIVKIPEQQAEEADKLTKRVEALVKEVAEKKPDKEMAQITADSLKKAAENLAKVVPAVLPIVTQIISHAMLLLQ